MLLALLVAHLVLAAIAVPSAARLGRRVFWLCALAPAATVVAAGAVAADVLAGTPVVETWGWAGGLGLTFDLRLDPLALVMVTLIDGIGVLVFAYSARYFSSSAQGLGRLASALVGFAGAMLGLVLSDNLLVLSVFWELTSITSFLLIATNQDEEAEGAARQALLVTAAGGLAMLGGFVLLGQAAGTYSLSAIVADPPFSPGALAGVLLAVVGAVTKSAQVPFHFWLPAAMAAPTPISAYLHSATMVKAGVYLIARLAPPFTGTMPGLGPLLATIGVATMLVGGWRALRQHDLKLLLAYGTVGQLGFLVALFGVGVPAATGAGVAMLLAHGAFKATLFLVVGIIDHQAHTRDLRELSGLGRRMPSVAAVAAVAAASMAGLPPLFGFVAKEAAFGALEPALLAAVGAGSVLTVAYTGRFMAGAFGTRPGQVTEAPRPSAAFVAPAAVLAALTLVAGLVPAVADRFVQAVASDVQHLALWHGVTPALGLSAATLVLGALLSRVEVRTPVAVPSAASVYDAALKGLDRVARLLTGRVQTGSLPAYLTVILLTTAALPTTALLGATVLPALMAPPLFAESPLQTAVGVGIAVAAIGTALARRRFAAVLLLGAVGYGVALLFVLQGAPDLALTQVLIETLTLVVFVLVLRHLPDRFGEREWRPGQLARRLIAGAVGLFVTAFALVATSARTAPSVAEGYLTRSLPEGHGRNVVNVILVDFRGFDTLGEITVLAVAALGIAALVGATREEREES